MTCPRSTARAWMVVAAAFIACAPTASTAGAVIEAITFAAEPGNYYVPMQDALKKLRWKVQRDDAGVCTGINSAGVPAHPLRLLTDGTELISTAALQGAGAMVTVEPDCGVATVSDGRRGFTLAAGPKRVEVSLAGQQLRAWQGDRLVLQTRISSGRNGRTPAGDFRAGPFRARMHYSSRYHHAPMPWSVQIYGHVFIHGFTEVPAYPASHGCIRLPLDGLNPAKFFYEWVDDGCPVRVMRG